MKLIKPNKDIEKSFKEMTETYKNTIESRYKFAFKDDFNFEEYINSLENNEKSEFLKPGYVPSTTFWLIDEKNTILGVSRLRHYLLANLEKEGGHIGYDVPPLQRKNGYGKILLKLTLEKAKEIEINPVLITCDKDNIGSIKIIEANGGIFENEIISDESGKYVNRYWINL